MTYPNCIKLLTLTFLLIFSVNKIDAQVTIGTSEAPEKYALLQIKDKLNATVGESSSTTGGFLLPRVELTKRTELLPFAQISDIGTPDYETTVKPAHKGLIVYNLVENDDEDLSIGLNQWDGEKWIGIQNKIGNAIGSISNCDSVEIYGTYKTSTPLTASNYIVVPLQITKAGAYNITIKPVNDNGFYFHTSGVFMAGGYYNLVVPGLGNPMTPSASSAGDELEIIFNGQTASCKPRIYVEDSSKKPLYIMDCARTNVYGSYIVDTNINPAKNYMTVRLDVHPNAEGAFYSIETDEVDGIKFSGNGYLQKGIQTVTLSASGKPLSVGKKTFTIKSNSLSSSSSCSATLYVAYKNMTILTLGYKDAIFDINNTNSGAGKLIRNPQAFGLNESSKVQIGSIVFNSVGGAAGPSDAQLSTALAQNPDIIIMTFDVYINTNQAAMYANYLNNGGVILAYNEGNGSAVQNLMRAVFPDISSSNITQRRLNAAGSVYQFSNVDDDLLNGTFGDIREQYWGEDRSQTASISGLPTDRIDIYSTGVSLSGSNKGTTSEVTAFKHKDLNFMWVGDGGFMAYLNSTDHSGFPYVLDAANMPTARINYGATTKYTVQNSIFYANALAWAIKCASQTGINVP